MKNIISLLFIVSLYSCQCGSHECSSHRNNPNSELKPITIKILYNDRTEDVITIMAFDCHLGTGVSNGFTKDVPEGQLYYRDEEGVKLIANYVKRFEVLK